MLRTLSTSSYLFLFVLLFAANVSLYREIFVPRALEISVLDVGEKGSATLVRSPSGETLLIDTGPDASILRALGTAFPPWQRAIDVLLLTSTHKESTGGLPDVESRYRVSTIIRISGKDVPYGSSFTFGGAPGAKSDLALGARIRVIAPGVLTISYGATSLYISSSTPAGTRLSDGAAIIIP